MSQVQDQDFIAGNESRRKRANKAVMNKDKSHQCAGPADVTEMVTTRVTFPLRGLLQAIGHSLLPWLRQ